jgi:adenylylsulfate kinase
MKETRATNITWHPALVTQEDRERRNGYQATVLWLTGLPSAGKSTLAHTVEMKLFERGLNAYVLDGDNLRHRLNRNLGFSPEDRRENIRRVGEVARLFTDAGVIVLAAFISPYREDRAQARALIKQGRFVEIHVKCSVETCAERDPKGLYKRARMGEIRGFTGVDAPYEEPEQPEIVVETDRYSMHACAESIIRYLEQNEFIPKPT